MNPAIALLLIARQTCTVTFVRHGETQANATGHYSERTLNSFSARGTAEVKELTAFLVRQPRFDGILVSPAPRTLATIAPYLAATHQKALVWPLLYECCTGRRPAGAHPTRFSFGPKILIPANLKSLFVVMPTDDRFPIAPQYDEGLAQVDAAIREFHSRFAKGKLLIVGHSGMGGHFIHELIGKWHKLDNAVPYTFTSTL